MVRIFLDGTEVVNPLEWEKISVSVKTDHLMQLTTIEYEETLTFIEDGYAFLYDKVNAPCVLIDVLVQMQSDGVWNDIVKGVIFIGDVTFNELTCEASVRIQDDGYSARVQNNKKLETGLGALTTKNGLAITAPTDNIAFLFVPSTGAYDKYVRGFRIYECLKFMVSWMTDNKVGFESDYFSTGAGALKLISSGFDLRMATNLPAQRAQPPKFKFGELFEVLRKLHNVGMGFRRDTNNNPILVIEELSEFRGSNVVLNINDVNETELSFIQTLLYGKIIVGSDITKPFQCNGGADQCTAGNNISYFGFELEEYAFTGECNKDTSLDLTLNDGYIIDTSTIEDILIYQNQEHDDENIIIDIFEHTPGAYRCVSSDVIGNGKYWYNEYYTNKEIIARYQEYLFGSLILFGLYHDIHLFKATGNISSGALSPLQSPSYTSWRPNMNVEVFDPDGVFDLTLDDFRPVDEGAYKFKMGTTIDEFSVGSDAGVSVGTYLQVRQYNSADVLIDTHQSPVFFYITGTPAQFLEWTSDWVNMDEGDYCIFWLIYAQDFNVGVKQAIINYNFPTPPLQYFECTDSRVAVRDNIPTVGSKRRTARTKTEGIPVAWDDMKAYLNDTTKRIRISNQRIDRTGWNDTIKHTFVSGKTDVSILND